MYAVKATQQTGLQRNAAYRRPRREHPVIRCCTSPHYGHDYHYDYAIEAVFLRHHQIPAHANEPNSRRSIFLFSLLLLLLLLLLPSSPPTLGHHLTAKRWPYTTPRSLQQTNHGPVHCQKSKDCMIPSSRKIPVVLDSQRTLKLPPLCLPRHQKCNANGAPTTAISRARRVIRLSAMVCVTRIRPLND